ncbi:hypothetical protein LIER_18426 [Lithospermum erythrorhizon]|uniref:Uncharacterized protein n=1 Tax=Lithospermum erythrorhizon TaxID=34254 RepID=A0AAV3QF79_LITER
MAPTVRIANHFPQNTNVSTTQNIEQQVQMDIPGPSEKQGVPPVEQFSQDDIRKEVQRRVQLVREQEIQRQVDIILERDKLVHEEQARLEEEAIRAEHEHRERILSRR